MRTLGDEPYTGSILSYPYAHPLRVVYNGVNPHHQKSCLIRESVPC